MLGVAAKIPELILLHTTVSKVIIQAGTNDIWKQYSKLKKCDLTFYSLKKSNVSVFISGPPPISREIDHFSTLLS